MTLGLILTAPGAAYGADIGIGEITDSSTLQLARSALLTRNTLNHYEAGIQSERYIEWGGDSQLSPVVFANDKLYNGALTLNDAARRLTDSGKEVAAGMNGDFFTVSNGVPQGVVVTDGIIRSSGSALAAVGFDGYGGIIIGKPYFDTRLSFAGKSVVVDEINKVRRDGGLYLYTPDFGDDTHTVLYGKHIVLETTGDLRIGGTVSGVVTEVLTGTEPASLTEGRMCLSVTSNGPLDRIDGLNVGMAVTISVSARDPRFTNCPNIVGGYHPLITNGVVQPYDETARAPRTAVGIRADGSAVFYTVDGRQSEYSAGLTLTELGERLKLLGCVEAVEFDGGGSTNMSARLEGETGLTQLGKPSDGAPRKCATYIFFVNDSPLTGVISNIYVKPSKMTVLAGSKTDLNGLDVLAADTNYHMLESPGLGGLVWHSENPLVCDIGRDQDGDGVMSALAAGTSKLNVYAPGSPGVGTLEITVTNTPDSIRIINAKTNKEITELTLNPGENAELNAIGVYAGKDMVSDNALFGWQITGSDASVTPGGVVTAGPRYGSTSYLVVAMGGKTLTLPIVVGKPPSVLADFESASGTPFSAVMPGTGFTRDAARANVKFGRFSGEFKYDFSLAGGAPSVTYAADAALPDGAQYINLWVRGDCSGGILNLVLTGAAGQEVEITAAALDGTDYRFCSAAIPAGMVKLSGIKLIRAGNGAESGAFGIDNVCAAYSPVQGITPPVIEFSVQGNMAEGLTVAGTVRSTGGPVLLKTDIKVLWDGAEIPFQYDPASGAISAKHDMPSEGFHRVTVEAANAGGGYERVSKNLAQPTALRPESFADINGHWGAPNIEFLDRKGVYPAPAGGARAFSPDSPITRAEVAVLMARVLKLDPGEWANTALPYADVADIPADALPAVKALYGVGVMRGGEVNGILSFNPGGAFTRAESFVLLANAFPVGMSKPVIDFTYVDAASIPAYAAGSISLLMQLQIVEGDNNNRIDPHGVVTRAGLAKLLCSFY